MTTVQCCAALKTPTLKYMKWNRFLHLFSYILLSILFQALLKAQRQTAILKTLFKFSSYCNHGAFVMRYCICSMVELSWIRLFKGRHRLAYLLILQWFSIYLARLEECSDIWEHFAVILLIYIWILLIWYKIFPSRCTVFQSIF